MILAAGYATRMYPLNRKVHKALLPLGTETILGHMVDILNELPDCREILIVSNHRFIEDFQSWLDQYHGRIPVCLLDDGTVDVSEAMGAIGDICYTIEQKNIDEDLLIVAGDTYFDFSLEGLVNLCRKNGKDGMCVKKMEDRSLLSQMGVVLLDEDQTILNIEEKPAQPKSDLAMYAIYYYTRDTVKMFTQYRQEKNPMDAPGNFIVWLYTRKAIVTYAVEGQCHDIGTVEAYARLCRMLGIPYSGEEEAK